MDFFTQKEVNMKEIFDKFKHIKLSILSTKRFPKEGIKTKATLWEKGFAMHKRTMQQ